MFVNPDMNGTYRTFVYELDHVEARIVQKTPSANTIPTKTSRIAIALKDTLEMAFISVSLFHHRVTYATTVVYTQLVDLTSGNDLPLILILKVV